MTVTAERAAFTAEGLTIVPRETWGAVQDYSSARPVQRAEWLFLHIAVVDELDDLVGTEDDIMRNIERIGQARFGIGCSYNAAVFDSGRLYEAQPLGRRGAHTVNDLPNPQFPTDHGGSLNHLARALVLPQDVDDEVTDAQIDTAARWGAVLCRRGFAVPGAPWFGHRDVTRKGCPGDAAYARLAELERLTRHYEATGLTPEDEMSAADVKRLEDKLDELLKFAERSHPAGDVKRGETWAIPTYWNAADAANRSAAILAELAGLREAVAQLGAGGDIDYGKVEVAAEKALRDVLGGLGT